MLLPQTTMFDNNKCNLAFINNFSSIYGDIDVHYCRDIIEKNIDIFPQYYSLISEHHNYFSDIDKFIFMYFKLQNLIPKTLESVEKYFNYDLLELYASIKKYNNSLFNNIYSANDSSEILRYIKPYINNEFNNNKLRSIYNTFNIEF